jgi:hypothetical protein
MTARKNRESSWQALFDITLIPAAAHLPAVVRDERRNVPARHAVVCRICSEFEEMRGLSLTLNQAARLFGLPPDIASRILHQLTDARVLCQKSDGQFSLLAEESSLSLKSRSGAAPERQRPIA